MLILPPNKPIKQTPNLLFKLLFPTHKVALNHFDLLIFSDDKQWCKDNLNYTSDNISQEIVEGLSDLEELYVMSLCDHFIVGSSSYSWWAAWLGQSEDKIVIVADKWFKNLLYHGIPLCDQEKDIFLSSWIKLSSDT